MKGAGRESVCGELPVGWTTAHLEALVETTAPIIYGILQPGPEQESGVPYVRPTEIVRNKIQLDQLRRTTVEIARKYKRASLRGDDVLLSIVGTVGKVAVVPAELDGANITQSSARIRAKKNLLDPRFLAWLLRSPVLRAQYDSALLGTGVPRLNIAHVRALDCPLPPLNEQRRIVAKLDALNEKSTRAKEALEAVPPLLEKLRQSILAAAFRGDLTKEWRAQNPNVEPASKLLERIRAERRRRWEEAELEKLQAKGKLPKDDSWKKKYQEPAPVDTEGLPELPEGWCWAAMEELLTEDGLGYGVLKPGERTPGGVPMIRVMDLKADSIDTSELYEIAPSLADEFSRTRLVEGDVLLAVMATIGRCAVVPATLAGANVNRALAVLRLAGVLLPDVLLWMMRSPHFISAFLAHKVGSAQQRINLGDLRRFPVPVPAVAEQGALLAYVERAMRDLSRLSEGIRQDALLLNELDEAVLRNAFRGELVPQDPADEPAATLLARLREQAEADAAAPSKSRGAPQSGARTREKQRKTKAS